MCGQLRHGGGRNAGWEAEEDARCESQPSPELPASGRRTAGTVETRRRTRRARPRTWCGVYGPPEANSLFFRHFGFGAQAPMLCRMLHITRITGGSSPGCTLHSRRCCDPSESNSESGSDPPTIIKPQLARTAGCPCARPARCAALCPARYPGPAGWRCDSLANRLGNQTPARSALPQSPPRSRCATRSRRTTSPAAGRSGGGTGHTDAAHQTQGCSTAPSACRSPGIGCGSGR